MLQMAAFYNYVQCSAVTNDIIVKVFEDSIDE